MPWPAHQVVSVFLDDHVGCRVCMIELDRPTTVMMANFIFIKSYLLALALR